MTYPIDVYKTENLSPDELNAKRWSAAGIWRVSNDVTAGDRREALRIARQQTGKEVRIGKR